jgi:hypothetical protein
MAIFFMCRPKKLKKRMSSYLNLDGEGEGHQQGDDEGAGTIDGGQPSTNTSGDVDKQLAPPPARYIYTLSLR